MAVVDNQSVDDPMAIILFRYAIRLLYGMSFALLLKHLETWPENYVPGVKA